MSTPDGSLVTNDSDSRTKVPCPYADCTGYLARVESECSLCRRAISHCPNGHLIAADYGFCDVCGYDENRDRADPICLTEFVLSGPLLLELIADAYHEAALANLNMRSATEVLEALKTSLAQESEYHKAWDKLDEHIGRTLDKRLRQVMMGARDRFAREVIAGEISRLEKISTTDPAQGWDEWLRTYVAALVNWRLVMAKALTEVRLAFSPAVLPVVEQIRRVTGLVIDERWPEMLSMFRYLSQQDAISALHRAWLLVVAGEIELYQLRRAESAKKLYDEAQQLAPEDGRAMAGQAEYFVQTRQFDKAKEQIQRVIAAMPQASRGYALQGELYEQQEELDRAEEAYQQGIRVAPGETESYSRLLRLNGRRERLTTYENRLLPLRDIAAAIEPLDDYSLLLDLGAAYQQNERYDEAHSWYDQAVRSNRNRLGAYIAKGYAYLETDATDRAHAMFAKAIEVTPEASDGYWGMYLLHDQKGERSEATEAYEESLRRLPELTEPIWGFLEDGKPESQTFDQFKDQLIEALRAKPENETLLNNLTNLADVYAKNGRTDAAVNLYGRIREAKGPDYEAEYRNSVGNIRYDKEDYQGAAEAYQAAIKANSTEPDYYANLSLSYQGMKQWNEARAQLELAKDLKPESQLTSHAQQMAAVWNAEGNDCFAKSMFKEAIECYKQAIALDDSEAVYHSNLSLGWENLLPEHGKLEALENAKNALEAAANSEPENQTFTSRLDNLKRQLDLAATYGDHIVGKRPIVNYLTVEVASDLIPFVASEGALLDEVMSLLEELRQRIFTSMGIRVPQVHFKGNEGDLPPGWYVIMLMEVPIVMGSIGIQKRLFLGSAGQLADLGVKGEETNDPLTGNKAYWVDQEQCETINAAGLETLKLMEYPVRHVESVIRHNLNEFIDHQEVSDLLANAGDAGGSSDELGKLSAFTILLRALVSEEVPIVALSLIKRNFSESLSQGKDLMTIVEDVRSLPEIRLALPGNNANHSLYRLGERITREVSQCLRTENGHKFLVMAPETCQEVLAAVRNEISSRNNPAIIVEQAELRPLVRRLTEIEWPYVPVLSSNELRPELASQILGEIELA